MKGHWSRNCRTPKHLVDLYQASIKEKGKGIETNFVDHNDLEDPMNYLDLSNGVDMTHCVVYVPIVPLQLTKMGPQCRLGIYSGFDSPPIIRYLEPLIGDVFMTCLRIVILMKQSSHH